MSSVASDRYQLDLDCRPFVGDLATVYHHGHFWKVPDLTKRLWQAQCLRAFDKLLRIVSVKFIKDDCEPYSTTAEMSSRISTEGVFLVRWRHPGSHPLGSSHSMFRAVHDYFGHVVGDQPFTMDGELTCYNIHACGSMFSPATLPLVWSEVVLENAFRVFHGHWYWHSKPVFDPHWGQIQWADLEKKPLPAALKGSKPAAANAAAAPGGMPTLKPTTAPGA